MQPIAIKRDKQLQKVSPFTGFKFKNNPSTVSDSRAIYTPERDHPSFHLVLQNMRNSFNYLKDDNNFKKPFINHLKKTGFDETGIICRREWYTNKDNRKRKFGQGDDSFIDYPWVADKYWNLKKQNEKEKMFRRVINSERKKSLINENFNEKKKEGEVVEKRRLASAAPFRRKRNLFGRKSQENLTEKYEEKEEDFEDNNNDNRQYDDRNLTERRARPMTCYRKISEKDKLTGSIENISKNNEKRRLQSADPRMTSEKRYRHYVRKQKYQRPLMKNKNYRKNDRFSRTPYEYRTGLWLKQTTFDPVRAKITPKITLAKPPPLSTDRKSRSRSMSKSRQKYCKLFIFLY